MPLISQNIPNSPLLIKAAYQNHKEFIKVKPLSKPNTSLGSDWTFKQTVMSARFRQFSDEIQRMDVYGNDVWTISYPECGMELFNYF